MKSETKTMAKDIRERIHSVRQLYQPLVLLSERKVRLNHEGSKPTTAPLPVNLTALQLVMQTDKLTDMLGRAAGYRFRHNLGTPGMLIWLDDHEVTLRLAERADAAHIESVLQSLQRRMDWLLYGDAPKRYIGVCPHCGWGVWVPEHDKLKGTRHCEMCECEYDLEHVCQAHRLRLMMSNHVDTLRKIGSMLRSCGYDINMNTLRTWSKRGKHGIKLKPVGVNEDGANMYRISDVMRICSLV